MVLSKPCQYAIQAMLFLSEQERGRLYPVREISRQAQVPLPYLSKILGRLAREGLIEARRGPHGGVMLSRRPGKVSLGEIVQALDGAPAESVCYLGLAECSDRQPCPVHESWKRLRRQLDGTLNRKTLVDLKRVTDRRPRGWAPSVKRRRPK
jgi:Rrf2 family protein